MDVINCIIVDDDEIDRLMVTSFVKKFPEFKINGIFEDAEMALQVLDVQDIDVLFLDIDMPGESGLELRKKALHIPVCIFITSHPEHAVESFGLETLDFIVKPLKMERFADTVRRISEFMEVRKKASLYEASLGADVIVVKEGHGQIKVKLHEILYLEALKDYTLLVTEKSRHCVLSNLGSLLNSEHFGSFVRVHRSFAVQKQRVRRVTAAEIEMDTTATVPVGRSFKDNLMLLL
ncbi:LytR/AlgR family response regulator transcription factor [Flagellimonas amoyensis]|uniref:LytR/AlgR family response regulator transcription factor n=1 Tax=Flagellimonas amoyensis TaxID=2169401 RepID=UPI000D3CF327|nr:LytTR family DNA-binding domain-containing protein [Allomuricauda amoyensis]